MIYIYFIFFIFIFTYIPQAKNNFKKIHKLSWSSISDCLQPFVMVGWVPSPPAFWYVRCSEFIYGPWARAFCRLNCGLWNCTVHLRVNSARFRAVCLDMLLICPFKDTVLCKWLDWNLWRETEFIFCIICGFQVKRMGKLYLHRFLRNSFRHL